MALVRYLTLYLTLTSYIHAQNVLISNYRLPTDITAVFYKLTIEPNLNEFKFCGNLSIKLLVENSTTKLILNVKDLQLNYNNIHLYDSLGNRLKIKSFEENVEYERLFIEPEVPFGSGKYYDIHFNYCGNINDDGIGLYRSSYVVGNQVEWMAVSQLRPVHARRMFPCFDEPSFRAVFSLNIIHHPDYKVVSNMPIQNIERYRDESLLTSFDDTPPIPAFLVAVIISKMEQVDGLAGFSSLATPDKLQSMIYSAEIGPKLAAAMQNYIGLQYPLNKTHQAALPRLTPVAMENWGLYNYKEENILYLEGESPTLQKQTAARYSAHEICHAWMGNMVSLGWWDYLWMSEVYAMFYEYNIPHMVDPCWRMNEQLVTDLHQAGLLMDSMPVEPLTTSVLTPTQISNKFGGVTYTKGPAILRMAIHVLEELNFLKGFQQLLIDYAYKSIPNPETMWTYLEEYKTQKLPASLKDIMSLWTTASGYPVVNVVVQPHRILLSQVKFSLENDTQDFQPWWIPLTFTTGKECNFEVTKPKDWFKPQKMHEINLTIDGGDWILFNIKSVGFYRVNYNKNNWNNLIDQLNKNCSKFPAVNRAQLIDDSFNIARSGKLDYNTALTLASYLIYETDFIPWKAAINAFDFLDNVLLNSSLRSIFKAYIKDLVNNVYLAIGFEEKECDGHVDKINREQIVKLGCESGHHHCIENAKRFVSSLISGYQPKISADVYETVICSAVYYGGIREWEYVLSLYQLESATSRRKSFYLSILGCSNDPDFIRRYITDNLEALTTEQWMERFRAFSNRKENVNFMLQILYEKYDTIVAKINKKNFVSLLKTMENFFTTEEQLKKITELESNNITGVSDIRIKLQKTIQWLNTNLPQLSVFFRNDRTYQLVFSN